MASQNFKSAGVSIQEIDLTFSQTGAQPAGVPACVVGTSQQGPAYVPITVATKDDFFAKFGSSNGNHPAVIAGAEWLRNATSLTFVRTLGIGDGTQKNADGTVNSAGFTVGEKLPSGENGTLADNPNSSRNSAAQASDSNDTGRTFFLGAFMSASGDSTIFSESNVNLVGSGSSTPVIRAVLMTARGVKPYLSCSFTSSVTSASIGDVVLSKNGIATEEFVLVLNGHNGSSEFPASVTASFNPLSDNYLGNVLNTNPQKINDAGYVLYTHYDIHPTLAVVTGSGILSTNSGTFFSATKTAELAAFILKTSLNRNTSNTTTPNFENFRSRFTHPISPFIVSQDFGGTRFNLFKLHSLHDGSGHAEKVKFSIENITPSSDPKYKFGSFDLLVRDFNDFDNNKLVLEQFRNINLDPTSDRYIAKVIGDAYVYFDLDTSSQSQKLVFEGSFPNNSSFIRVEVSSDVENGEIPEDSLPVGYRGILHLQTSGSSGLVSGSSEPPLFDFGGGANEQFQLDDEAELISVLKSATEPPLQFRKSLSVGTGANKIVDSAYYWGVQTEHVSSLTEPNKSTLKNKTILNHMKYFPDFAADGSVTCWVGNNEGTLTTSANGILDADKFHNNLFSLENILVMTTSADVADHRKWVEATYNKNPNSTAANKRHLKVSDFTQQNREYLKFTFFMQGGFDGINIFDSNEAKLNNTAIEHDFLDGNRGGLNGPNVKAYTKALELVGNVSELDFKLFVMPGIRNSTVTDLAIDTVEDRFDSLYLMDIEQYDDNGEKIISDSSTKNISVLNTSEEFGNRNLNTSFAAAYFPDVNIVDPTLNKSVKVPPSVAVLGAFSLNDAIGHPWFAPAGFTRGALSTTLETSVKLSNESIDTLYQSDINPLVAYPGTSVVGLNPGGGVVVWGQKTLLQGASSLDRVNVRRLLIEVRRAVREVANTFIFEPNRAETLARFSSAVQPRLQRIQQLGGLTGFKVNIDTSTTTQADVEANTIRGKVFVQPVKSLEFVFIDFVLSNRIG